MKSSTIPKLLILLYFVIAGYSAKAQNCPQRILSNDTTVLVLCSNDVTNLTNIVQTRSLSAHWDIDNPAHAILGTHRVAVDSSGCRDTAYITIRQDIKTWLGNVSRNWHNPLNWSDNHVPGDSTHVIITASPYPCVISNNDATAATIQVLKDGNLTVLKNRHLSVKGTCDSLAPLIELNPATVIIDAPTAQQIQSVDSTTMVFNGNSVQLESLSVGNIIVCGIAPNAPTGFLRKITAIQKNGLLYTFTTINASLADAFRELHIDYKKSFTKSDTLLRNLANLGTFTINMPDIILHDGDGDNSTTSDQLKVTGNLELSPSLDCSIHIGFSGLKYAKFEGGFQNTLTQSITAGGSIGSLSGQVIVRKGQICGLLPNERRHNFTPC